MQDLPIGIQTFEDIRNEDFVYVDKTKHLFNLVRKKGVYFLSRPRRFGKSLTISTLEAMFQGKAELFKGLYAEEWVKEKAKHPNPVIKLDMSGLGNYTNISELSSALIDYLGEIIDDYNLNIQLKENAGRIFAKIIKELYKKFGKVVLLIDEYDKPITDNINDLEKANEIRDFFRKFYGILKNSSTIDNLHFVFITGVSKFSKAGIFSCLNNLEDISMTREYADIVGYTQQELEENFSDWLEKTEKKLSFDRKELLATIKKYYDGFSFDGIVRVYNPFSVLNFFKQGNFGNYWYNSALFFPPSKKELNVSSFLAKYLKSHKIKAPKEYTQKKVYEDFTNSHEIESTSVESFLYQAGYLTISERKGNILILDYPNEEVKSSMDRLFLENFYNIQDDAEFSNDIWESLEAENIPQVVSIFNESLKAIPENIFAPSIEGEKKQDDYKDRDESWYRSLFLMLLSGAKITYFSEVHTFRGRPDVVVSFRDKLVVVIEFKFALTSKDVNKKRKEGEEQIKSRDYASAYKSTKKIITAVFVADDEKRQIII